MANTDKLEDAIAFLQTLAKTFTITRGKEGSLIFDGEKKSLKLNLIQSMLSILLVQEICMQVVYYMVLPMV